MSLNRAYSLLEIKSIDDDQRVIEGLATSAEIDRVGDIVESKGAEFKLPIPLLWQHDRQQPIGEVFAAVVKSDGIHIKARILKLDEPGKLKDRLDEAWQSIKHKLVRGLSIGFSPIEYALMDTGGLRFLKWLWLELSAVTIPANADASIQAIKSLDAAALAASGSSTDATPQPAGVSAHRVVKAMRKDRSMAKTLAEQIKDFEATRETKQAEMSAMMTTAGDAGETLDKDQAEKYDTLSDEVKAINEHLTRLADLEEVNKAKAAPVNGKTADDGAAARGGNSVIRVKDQLPPGIEFARYAMCVMLAKGNLWQAQEIAKSRYPDQPRILSVIKAAVAAGTTTDTTWAGNLVDYQNFVGDFIEYLRPSTIIGKFGMGNVPSLRRVPFNVRIMGQTSGGNADWVGQAKPKPLTKFDFAPTTMTCAKVAAIAVLAEELVRFSNPSAEALVRDALRDAIVARLDTDFVDPDKGAVANVSPASITNNVAPIATAGSSAADVRVDIMALMAPFIAANISPAGGVFIMSQTRALALSLMQNALGQPEYPDLTMLGGTFRGFPAITSQYAVTGSPASDLVIFLNAPDIYLADDGQVVIDASREASLEMLDSGLTQDGAAGTGASLVSLWQNNLLGLRAERIINWAKRRPDAVAYLEDVTWGATGGSPA